MAKIIHTKILKCENFPMWKFSDLQQCMQIRNGQNVKSRHNCKIYFPHKILMMCVCMPNRFVWCAWHITIYWLSIYNTIHDLLRVSACVYLGKSLCQLVEGSLGTWPLWTHFSDAASSSHEGCLFLDWPGSNQTDLEKFHYLYTHQKSCYRGNTFIP